MQKIAVLGGGMSAMTAVFEITEQPNWQDNYDITVYQLGWRIGGKGASGRNAKYHERIEEHGLHLWFGFYENSFNLMQRAYGAMNPPANAAFQTWQDAFKPLNQTILEDEYQGRWENWLIDLPTNSLVPGEADSEPKTPYDYIAEIMSVLHRLFGFHSDHVNASQPQGCLGQLVGMVVNVMESAEAKLLQDMHTHIKQTDAETFQKESDHHNSLLDMMEQFIKWLESLLVSAIEHVTILRRLLQIADFGFAVIRGMLADDVIVEGFDVINGYEFTDWLVMHGMSESNRGSVIVRATYDFVFGFRNGDATQRDVAAGVMLRGSMRSAFDTRGSVIWKMQAGMGDTVFTPFYTVLKERGVKFKFFRRVKNLKLSEDKNSIGAIELARQVDLKGDDYYPLRPVTGMDGKVIDCWPNEPLWEQLNPEQAEKLQAENIDLENFYTAWEDVGEETLVAGEHFDKVIFGIPIASVQYLCKELISASPKWQAMVDNLVTTQTQAMQLWCAPTTAEMGWTISENPIVNTYVEPVNTWADMSHLLPRETWSGEDRPHNVSYFGGVMLENEDLPRDHTFKQRMDEIAKNNMLMFLQDNFGFLVPEAASPDNPTGLNWDVLFTERKLDNYLRFDDQYWRANVSPSERYTMSAAKTVQYRIKADETGFDNLVITGDWIDNGFNTPGCIESCAISGLQACRAITGAPAYIYGESDFPPVRDE